MWRAVFALIIKELLAVLKDPKSRMVLVVPPLLQLVVFGYAATFDLNRVPIAVYDQDQSQASRDLVAQFLGSHIFKQVAALDNARQINPLIDSRQVDLVLSIDRRFSRDLLTHQPGPVQLIVDGRDSNTALIILGYANSIITSFSLNWMRTHGEPPAPALLDVRAQYNPTLSSQWFIVPGIIAVLTQVVTLMVVGLSVAREREAGTFDQLLVTPFTQGEILLGKGLPGLLIGTLEASVIILAAVLWFHVPLRGSLIALYLGIFLFVASVIGIGLMISSIAVTQQQALLGAFLFMVPSIILSGFATPIANMPTVIRELTWLNPMRHILIIVRGTFLEGSGVHAFVPEYLALAATAALSLLAAGWLFRKRAY